MLANTLTVTIAAVARVLTRVNQDNYGSTYRLKNATESLELKIRNTTDKSFGFPYDRHFVELSWLVYATATTPEYHRIVSMTLRQRTPDDPAKLIEEATGFYTLIATIDDAIAGGES